MDVADFNEQKVLDDASRLLGSVTSLDDVRAIRNKAEAVRAYAQAARLGLELQNRAAALKLRAERKAGGMLTALRMRGGDRRSKKKSPQLKLIDLGVSRTESRRWQELASVSETAFCNYLEEMKQRRRKVTASGLIRIANQDVSGLRYGPIVSDDKTGAMSSHRPVDVEAVIELANHVRRLIEVLRPVCASSNLRMAFPEMGMVGRLLTEIGDATRQITGDGEIMRRRSPGRL
jgi:hypothetical protein